MPLLGRKKVLQVLEEGTKGSAEAAPNLPIPAYDLEINPDDTFIQRQFNRATLGHAAGVVGARTGRLTGRAELISDGTDALDDGIEDLLLACGWKLSGGVLSPESTVASQKTLTAYLNAEGVKKQLYGAMGNAVIEGEVGGIVTVSFELSGVWTAPTDVALPTPSYPARTPLRAAAATFTLHGYAMKISRFRLSLNTTVSPRQDITKTAGVDYFAIVERDPTFECDPEAELVATHDFMGLWLAGTEAALALTLTDGDVDVAIAAPKVQYRQVAQSEREQFQTYDLTGQMNSSAAAGDDEATITPGAA